MRTAIFGIVSLVVAALSQPTASDRQHSFDTVLLNGHVIDGTGSPWYAADVGIRDGRIAAVGRLSDAAATQRIDVHGKVVAPGFIDMLGQSELTLLVDPHVPSKIFQGITTEITGEGGSVAPLNDAIIKADRVTYEHLKITPDWRTLAQYFSRLEHGLAINFATYVGATQIRRMVLGDEDRQPTAAELDRMKGLVREAMEEGAVGVSTALEYTPAPYAKTDELVALAAEAAKYGGVYATHARIEQARRDGVDITADTYAYPAWLNSFSAFVPPWAHAGGDEKLIERLKDPEVRLRIRKDLLTPSDGWDNEWQEIPGPEAITICVVQNPDLKSLQGKTLAEVARLWDEDAIDALFDILVKDRAYTFVAAFGMSEADIALAVSQPWIAFDTDSPGTAPTGPSKMLLRMTRRHNSIVNSGPRSLDTHGDERTWRLREPDGAPVR